ncbi:hypothetical protein HF865_03520 [Lactobacillus reuteri]|uniref:Uncharacterized protein n=1 Tax=Limosilactobacillus reuteri TaxID=1598 RepID=A0AAW9ZID6_LIMRT|nr:hypothetical protein [Limosilactobacillus reuteri]NME21780.1 hypothetical protein [Limosilactobacillus reuteri]
MTENQTETLTDDQLFELAKDLIEDHEELKDENVTTDDLVKILNHVDSEFVKSMYNSKYQVVLNDDVCEEIKPSVSVKYLLRDLAAASIAEELKSLNYSANGLTDEILNFAVTSVNSYMTRKNDLSGIYANIEHFSDLVNKNYCSIFDREFTVLLEYGRNSDAYGFVSDCLYDQIKDIVNSDDKELLPSDQIEYKWLIKPIKERQEQENVKE